MALRRPAACLRRAPEDALAPAARLPRAPRPHSAVEGRQLDDWLQHLQSSPLMAAVHDHLPAFSHRTASAPAFDKEPPGHPWRQLGIPPFSRRSSSCGSSTQCESPLGSQESLQTGLLSSLEARGRWERAHIVQAPRKEQPQLSCLGQVTTGWLPVQRRVTMVSDACSQNEAWDPSVGQVKLKQPITPVFQKTRAIPTAEDGDVERCHGGQSSSGARTWQPPDHDSPVIKERPENQRSPATESERPVSWQVLRRGWNSSRVSVSPGGTQSTEPPTGTGPDPDRKPPLMKTSSSEPLRPAPAHQTAAAQPRRRRAPPPGPGAADAFKSQTAFNRKSGVVPVRATAPLCTTNRSPQPSRIQTSAAATTLVPQHQAGFSSITISSRKVSRSASLPGSASSRSGGSPSPPPAPQVALQHNATIVKVKEQRVIHSPACAAAAAAAAEGAPAHSQGMDTVVHRRRATIIKVTERGEKHRHSYTEGAYEDSSAWSRPQHDAGPRHLEATQGPRTAQADHGGGALQRSTLRIVLSNPPPNAAPAPLEDSPKAAGQRSDRPRRPLSWYGSRAGHAGPREENVTPAAVRKWSCDLPPEPSVNPVNSGSSWISSGTGRREAGQLVGDNTEDPERRASPCLTLIQAPDPHSRQTPEEVLALNAAAIIANIKLQRQLSKRKTQTGSSEEDRTASPQGNTVTDERKCPDQSLSRPPAGLGLGPEGSPASVSLQEALQRSRPDFIARSQGRVRELERRTRERRESATLTDAAVRQRGTRSASLKENRAVTGGEKQRGSKRLLKEVTRKKEEEQKREVLLSNRQKVALFRKKLLDHILQRSNS